MLFRSNPVRPPPPPPRTAHTNTLLEWRRLERLVLPPSRVFGAGHAARLVWSVLLAPDTQAQPVEVVVQGASDLILAGTLLSQEDTASTLTSLLMDPVAASVHGPIKLGPELALGCHTSLVVSPVRTCLPPNTSSGDTDVGVIQKQNE